MDEGEKEGRERILVQLSRAIGFPSIQPAVPPPTILDTMEATEAHSAAQTTGAARRTENAGWERRRVLSVLLESRAAKRCGC